MAQPADVWAREKSCNPIAAFTGAGFFDFFAAGEGAVDVCVARDSGVPATLAKNCATVSPTFIPMKATMLLTRQGQLTWYLRALKENLRSPWSILDDLSEEDRHRRL